MKVMIAVKGSEEERFFRQAVALLKPAEADSILLVHTIDSAPRADLDQARERFLIRRPISPDRNDELHEVEEGRARAVLQFARHALVGSGVPDERVHEMTLRGKPNDELRRLAEQERVSLIVVQGRAGKPGPHSVGKTARFLIDHCPAAALLIRSG